MRQRRATAILAALLALLAGGCTRVALGIANGGIAPPDATVTYAPAHGLRLDVYRPATAEAAPVVVFFYGGGWTSGARDDYRFVGRRLSEAGIVAMVADYRLFPQATFPGFVEDGAAAVAWARAHAADYGGDPARVFVAGHSAGAQIAALLATDPRYLRAQGLRPRDLAGVIGLSGPYDFVIDDALAPIFGDRARWPEAQPLAHVDGDESPFLLVHGDADRRVEARDSRQLAAALQALGEPATLLMLEDAGHTAPLVALYAPSREPRVLAAIRAFTGAR